MLFAMREPLILQRQGAFASHNIAYLRETFSCSFAVRKVLKWPMMDILFVGLTLGFFALAIAYVWGCVKL